MRPVTLIGYGKHGEVCSIDAVAINMDTALYSNILKISAVILPSCEPRYYEQL